MFNQVFYFDLIRKYTSYFGTLFNDIDIERSVNGTETELMRVPITYAIKEKMLSRVIQDPNIDKQSAIQLPIISFEISGFEYDPTRKLGNVNKITVANPSEPGSVNYQYSPVPYNIGFTLYIYAKNAEDGTKIIEQILPYFTPDWTSSLHLVPEMGINMEVPVVLNTVTLDDSLTKDFKDRQAFIWTLQFTMKAYFYGPVKSSAIIKFTNLNIFDPTVDILVDAVGVSSPAVTIETQPGLTANGTPTSNSSLSIPVSNIQATDKYGIVQTITEFG